MTTTIMLYWRSVKKVQKLFPESKFEGFENSFGDKCWISIESEKHRFTVIRTLFENRIKLLAIQ